MADKQRLFDHCPMCGKKHPEGARIDRVYCSKKCTMAARRSRERAAKRLQELSLHGDALVMLEKLRSVLPDTAKRLDSFVLQHGADCAEAAIKLVLTASAEAKAMHSA